MNYAFSHYIGFAKNNKQTKKNKNKEKKTI